MIASSLINQLIAQGVRSFCIAPGSRSTPLVLAAKQHREAALHVHFDERGLGFFALGLAKVKEEPVAIIVTSGTAVGNLLPSVMEAFHSHTPLILLTADRPHELRDTGANQTCDQVNIFQHFVLWQFDLSLDLEQEQIASIAAQGFFYAKQGGPVHINCPFREPLYVPEEKPLPSPKKIQLTFPQKTISSYSTTQKKGVIFIGKLPRKGDLHSILELASRLKWPVFGDILSNARLFPSPEQILYFDWIHKPSPDLILHFGDRMTSKHVLAWAKQSRPEYIHISPWQELQDPERIITARVQADIDSFCRVFRAEKDLQWLNVWKDQEPLFQEEGPLTEAKAMKILSQNLPPGLGIFLGNGMPIRDADHFLFPRSSKGFFSNRGLSGIDGNIATLAALAEEMPMLGFIGDQAALYDLNSLPLLKKSLHPVTLVISNNFGGGIFHHLSVASDSDFETLWAASHNYTFEKAAELFSLPYFPFEKIQEAFFSTSIVELHTNRTENYQYLKNRVECRV